MRLPLNKAWILFLEGISYGQQTWARVNYTTGEESDSKPAAGSWTGFSFSSKESFFHFSQKTHIRNAFTDIISEAHFVKSHDLDSAM